MAKIDRVLEINVQLSRKIMLTTREFTYFIRLFAIALFFIACLHGLLFLMH